MLKIGLIGIGNTGNQIAALAQRTLEIPVLAINSSEKDLKTIPESVPKFLISNKGETSQGAGKNRKLAQQYVKESVTKLMSDTAINDFILPLDVLFIVSSTGGGTGSGASLIMTKILSDTYPDTKVIPVGVLPVETEAKSAHVNTLEYLSELYNVLGPNTTYMLYDNDKFTDLPSHLLNTKVNEEVVADIGVLTCKYNDETPYDSIDEQDMKRVISFPGRLALARVENIKEKDIDIEREIIHTIKVNAHTDIQRDKNVVATAIISNLSTYLASEFNNHIPTVREFIGDPDHDFNHIIIHEDRKIPNNVFLILAGLSVINDRIEKIKDRIDEIDEAQKRREEESVLAGINLEEMNKKMSAKEKKESDEPGQANLKDIFGKFNI